MWLKVPTMWVGNTHRTGEKKVDLPHTFTISYSLPNIGLAICHGRFYELPQMVVWLEQMEIVMCFDKFTKWHLSSHLLPPN